MTDAGADAFPWIAARDGGGGRRRRRSPPISATCATGRTPSSARCATSPTRRAPRWCTAPRQGPDRRRLHARAGRGRRDARGDRRGLPRHGRPHRAADDAAARFTDLRAPTCAGARTRRTPRDPRRSHACSTCSTRATAARSGGSSEAGFGADDAARIAPAAPDSVVVVAGAAPRTARPAGPSGPRTRPAGAWIEPMKSRPPSRRSGRAARRCPRSRSTGARRPAAGVRVGEDPAVAAVAIADHGVAAERPASPGTCSRRGRRRSGLAARGRASCGRTRQCARCVDELRSRCRAWPPRGRATAPAGSAIERHAAEVHHVERLHDQGGAELGGARRGRVGRLDRDVGVPVRRLVGAEQRARPGSVEVAGSSRRASSAMGIFPGRSSRRPARRRPARPPRRSSRARRRRRSRGVARALAEWGPILGPAVRAERRDLVNGRAVEREVGEDAADQRAEVRGVRGTEADGDPRRTRQPVDDEGTVRRQVVEAGARRRRKFRRPPPAGAARRRHGRARPTPGRPPPARRPAPARPAPRGPARPSRRGGRCTGKP